MKLSKPFQEIFLLVVRRHQKRNVPSKYLLTIGSRGNNRQHCGEHSAFAMKGHGFGNIRSGLQFLDAGQALVQKPPPSLRSDLRPRVQFVE